MDRDYSLDEPISFLPVTPGIDFCRPVHPLDNLDDARADALQRGECVVFDSHGQFWSVPMELNIHQITEQIDETLATQLIRLIAS